MSGHIKCVEPFDRGIESAQVAACKRQGPGVIERAVKEIHRYVQPRHLVGEVSAELCVPKAIAREELAAPQPVFLAKCVFPVEQ